jgi:tetratricopeptide (TPR) repeat protein
MKAERRHELRENDLAHALEAGWRYIEERGRSISVGILVVAGAFLILALVLRSRAVAHEEQWRRYSQLTFENPETARTSLDTLAALAQDNTDSQFLLTALIQQGRQALTLAQKAEAPPDRALNEKAREAFQKLLEKFPENPLALGVAHCGLATTEENLFALTRNLAHKERALNHLNAVIENPKLNGMPFQRIALDRRKVLDETFTVVVFGTARVEEAGATSSVRKLSPDEIRKTLPVDVQLIPPPAPTPAAEAETDTDEPQVDEADPVEPAQPTKPPEPAEPPSNPPSTP